MQAFSGALHSVHPPVHPIVPKYFLQLKVQFTNNTKLQYFVVVPAARKDTIIDSSPQITQFLFNTTIVADGGIALFLTPDINQRIMNY